MARFLVTTPHQAEECVAMLRTLLDRDPVALMSYDFACAAGDGSNHIGYVTVDSPDAETSLEVVPPAIRARATSTPVAKVTPEEVRLLDSDVR